jgi:hypothetical protein
LRTPQTLHTTLKCDVQNEPKFLIIVNDWIAMAGGCISDAAFSRNAASWHAKPSAMRAHLHATLGVRPVTQRHLAALRNNFKNRFAAETRTIAFSRIQQGECSWQQWHKPRREVAV